MSMCSLGDHDRFMKRVKRLAGDLEWKSGGNVAFMTRCVQTIPPPPPPPPPPPKKKILLGLDEDTINQL